MPSSGRGTRGGSGVLEEHFRASEKVAGDRRTGRPKKSRICVLAIRTPIPLVKPITTGRGMYFTAVPEAGQPQQNEHDAGHQRAHEQPVDAVGRDDAGDHDHERAGGAADLRSGAAQCRDDEAGDDGAIDAVLRREAGGNGEGHGQGQGDQADRDPGDEIVPRNAAGGIAPPQAVDEFG